MKDIIKFIFVVVLGMIMMPVSYGQGMYGEQSNEPVSSDKSDVGSLQETRTIEGTVTSVDAGGGAVTVKLFNPPDLTHDSMTFTVAPDVTVYKGGSTVKSSDIQIGDVVTVEYYFEAPDVGVATSITVE